MEGKLAKHQKIEGGFVAIPKRTLRCKEYKELTCYSKVVYQTLLIDFIRDKKINPDNEIKMSYKQIESISGISERQIARCIKELVSKGFVKIINQGGLERNFSIYSINGRYCW